MLAFVYGNVNILINTSDFYVCVASHGGSQQCSRTIRALLQQPCIVPRHHDIYDGAIGILGKECMSLDVGTVGVVEKRRLEEDADRLAAVLSRSYI